MSGIIFVLSSFFVLSTAGILSDLWFGKESRWLRLLSLLVLYGIEVVLIELLTGLAGYLSALGVAFTAVFIFLLTCVIWFYVSGKKMAIRFSGKSSLTLMILVLIGIGFGLFSGLYLFQGTNFCQDDLTYHASTAAHWYLTKDISAGSMNYHYYVPMNAELFSLWHLLPFGQDGMVFLAGIYWVCLTVTAGAVLLRQMNLSLKWLGCFALFFCCSKDIYLQAFTTFTAVDLAGPAMILSALAFLACISPGLEIKRWPYILLAGFSAGFALGSKVPFITVSLALGIWLFFSIPARFHVRLGYFSLFCLAILVSGSFWYIRDIILTGNPVFPGQLGPFGGPLTRDIQYQTNIVGRLIQSGFDYETIRHMVIAHVSWPYGIFLVFLAGIFAGFYRLFHHDGIRRTILLILIVFLLMIATYPLMPFSAANNDPDSLLTINLRFLIGPFLVGILLFFLLLADNVRYRVIWLLLAVVGVVISYIRHSNPVMVPLLAGAILWYWLYPVFLERRRFLSLQSVCVFLPAMFGGLAFVFPQLQQKTNDHLLAGSRFSKEMQQAWKEIDSLPPGSRVTSAGYLNYGYYPLFGRHYQNQPWKFSYGYPSFVPLHIQWKDDPNQTVWDTPRFTQEQWLLAFSSLGGEYLLIYHQPDAARPAMHNALTNLLIADQINCGEGWELWKVKK
jgi:hypothetical protein